MTPIIRERKSRLAQRVSRDIILNDRATGRDCRQPAIRLTDAGRIVTDDETDAISSILNDAETRLASAFRPPPRRSRLDAQCRQIWPDWESAADATPPSLRTPPPSGTDALLRPAAVSPGRAPRGSASDAKGPTRENGSPMARIGGLSPSAPAEPADGGRCSAAGG
jgi:hypothetical protein